ncbi:hypothetical protein GCM10027072_16860 [Streptomyces bullii]
MEFHPGNLADQVERVDEIGEGLGRVVPDGPFGVHPFRVRHVTVAGDPAQRRPGDRALVVDLENEFRAKADKT